MPLILKQLCFPCEIYEEIKILLHTVLHCLAVYHHVRNKPLTVSTQ